MNRYKANAKKQIEVYFSWQKRQKFGSCLVVTHYSVHSFKSGLNHKMEEKVIVAVSKALKYHGQKLCAPPDDNMIP